LSLVLITRGVRDLIVCIQQEGEVIAILACPFIDSSGDAEKAFEALVQIAGEIENKWEKSIF